ncbi:MAG: winged helix-turn-helix transcriptional regulator [Bacteriovoracia bacterium]
MVAQQRKLESCEECPVEECLKFLAGAWTAKIMWYLKNGPRRFGDLRRDIGKISSKVLTDRLREMERQGVVSRKVLPTSPPTVEYNLTELGHEFGPVFEAMLKVARKLKRREEPAGATVTPPSVAAPTATPLSL